MEEEPIHHDSMPSPEESIILPVLHEVYETLKNHDLLDTKYTHKAMVLAEDKENAREIARLWDGDYKEKFGQCLMLRSHLHPHVSALTFVCIVSCPH